MSTKPKSLKAKTHVLPIKIDDKDRANILKEMVEIRSKSSKLELKLDELKTKQKEDRDVITDDIKDLAETIDHKFKVADTGVDDRPIKCFVRKNFDQDPPVREFVSEKGEKVLHSEVLQPNEFQLKADEWVVGRPGKGQMKVNKNPEDGEEESSELDNALGGVIDGANEIKKSS